MLTEFLYSILIVIVWTLAALVAVGLPLMGITWAITRWMALTLAESCLFAFVHIAVLLSLLQNYLALAWSEFWRPALWTCILSLIGTLVEGSLLHTWTDLTLFQATLVASGVNLLFAYIAFHSVLGSVPSFLRNTFFEDMIDDMEMEGEEIVSPPPKPRRKRRR